MASRFRDTGIWDEDWFIDLGCEGQNFWTYVTDNCNHAGIWKPNKSGFEMRTKAKVNLDSFFAKVNGDKERIFKLKDGNWFLTGFIQYQWFNKKKDFDLVLTNRMHLSIYNELKKFQVPKEKIRGLQEVLETSKEMVKDKEQVKELVFGEKKELSIAIKKVFANDLVKRVYDLEKFFEATDQLESMKRAGMDKFDEFMMANPANVFEDDNHLYNSFRKFCVTDQLKKVSKKEVSLEELKAHRNGNV
jgi:hypothetical protein